MTAAELFECLSNFDFKRHREIGKKDFSKKDETDPAVSVPFPMIGHNPTLITSTSSSYVGIYGV